MEILFNSYSKKETVAKKIALESIFVPEVSRYLNKINKDFKKVYIATGLLIFPEEYTASTIELLKKHYNRVAKVFERNLRDNISIETKQFEDEKEKELKKANDVINASLIIFILQQSKKRAKFLIETTIKEIREKLVKAKQELLEEKVIDPNNKQIATKTSKLLNKSFKGRTETIAITETEFMAESTKTIETNVLQDKKPFPTFTIPLVLSAFNKIGTKEWRAVLDSRTRFAHLEADGQIKKIDEPFEVGNELLMYPSDSSLGASAGNTINCRCGQNIIIKWSKK